MTTLYKTATPLHPTYLTLGADWLPSHFLVNLPLTQSLEGSERHFPSTLSATILPSRGRHPWEMLDMST